MISKMIASEIASNRAEERTKYLVELRDCIISGKASRLLNKLANGLGYSQEQIESDELKIMKAIELLAALAANAVDMADYDIKFKKLYSELVESNVANEQAFKNNQLKKLGFINLQNAGDRMLSEKNKLSQELEQLNEYK